MFGYVEGRVGIVIADRTRSLVEGLSRVPWQIRRFDLFNADADSLFSVPGAEEMIAFPDPGRPGLTRHRPHVFGKFTQLAASTNRVYVAPTDAFSIQVFDPEGILRRIIRRVETPRSVTPSDLDQWVEGQLELRDPPPEERAEMIRTAGELSVAETMPAFRWMAVDTEDDLWVEEWEGVGLDQGRLAVFRSDGAWLGYVDLPEGLPQSRGDPYQQLIEIGSDYLLRVWTDYYGVEQVRLYRMEKR
jgi:hypothetical protein